MSAMGGATRKWSVKNWVSPSIWPRDSPQATNRHGGYASGAASKGSQRGLQHNVPHPASPTRFGAGAHTQDLSPTGTNHHGTGARHATGVHGNDKQVAIAIRNHSTPHTRNYHHCRGASPHLEHGVEVVVAEEHTQFPVTRCFMQEQQPGVRQLARCACQKLVDGTSL